MKAISRSTYLWLKASPRGRRSGFTILPDGSGGRVTVTVLPKPWSSTNQTINEYVHLPGETTHITTYETDVIAIRTTVQTIGSLAMSLTETNAVHSELLTIGEPAECLVESSSNPVDPFGHLVDLLLLAERGNLKDSPLNFEGTFTPSLLRLLQQERLLGVVEELIFRARPRYVEQTEILGIPRGRLNPRSLLLSITTGVPSIESTFDELSTDTTFLQIVASALRVIATERLPPKIDVLRPRRQGRAIQLLQHLSTVTLLDRQSALLLAKGIWIGSLDQVWKPAIDAAIPVLSNWAVSPIGTAETTEAVTMHISTEKFWEQCLGLALRRAFRSVSISRDGAANDGVSVPVPWMEAESSKELPSGSFPDFMLCTRRRSIVADAKYKLSSGLTLGASDGYQLFAYSHLATLNEKASDLAVLLYPTRHGDPGSNTELRRLREREYSLWLARLPFPTATELRNQQSWNSYITKLVSQLQSFADEWIPEE